MSSLDVIRAWKDARYRKGLSSAERAALPQHPSGLVELTDEELQAAAGAFGPAQTTAMTCTESSFRGWRACCPR